MDYALGRAISLDGREFLVADDSIEGFVLFGPYKEFPPGRYAVDFEIGVADGWKPDVDSVCGFIDVSSRHGTRVHANLPFFASQISRGLRKFTLAFELHESAVVEFRVCHYRVAPIIIAYDRDAYPIAADQGRYTPAFPLDGSPSSRFVDERLDEIQASHKKGISFTTEGGKCIASVESVSIEVENTEDFQLLEEIFNVNEYNFSSDGKFTAIDIGMNIGIASLFLAGIPNVEKVYSFEPFDEPFRRALKNFERNPKISSKITPQKVGLSDVDKRISVGFSTERTISTSIKGTESEQSQSIEIRNAALTLQPIFDEARSEGRGVVMKVDCEGSEFAVIDSLAKHNLLKDVSVFMIEWHKWWSTSLNRSALIDPLKRAGFVVLDRTAVTNPHAGMILAVRSV